MSSYHTVIENRRISPSVSNTESPTPSASGIDTNDHVPIVEKTKASTSLSTSSSVHFENRVAAKSDTEGHQAKPQGHEQQQCNDDTTNHHIPSPPVITNWHTMSTAATTITSNRHPHRSQNQQHRSKQHINRKSNQALPFIPPFVVPPQSPNHHNHGLMYRPQRRPSTSYVICDDKCDKNESSSNKDVDVRPPVCEIQIPMLSSNTIYKDEDEDDDENTTSSTQNLSITRNSCYPYGFENRNHSIDYKSMYFVSQKQNFHLQSQLQYVHDDNRRLKRQLIELQKQLYTHLRNKRPISATSTTSSSAVGSMHFSYSNEHNHHHNCNTNTGMNVTVPWTIPTSTSTLHGQNQQYQQQQHQKRQKILLSSSTSITSETSPEIKTTLFDKVQNAVEL